MNEQDDKVDAEGRYIFDEPPGEEEEEGEEEEGGERCGESLISVIDAALSEASIDGFDFDFGPQPTKPPKPSDRERAANALRGLSVGDVVKIGRENFEIVKSTDPISHLAKVKGTKGTKWYSIRTTGLSPITFGAFEMLGGGMRYAKKPRAEGVMKVKGSLVESDV